jgi:ABC-type polysaccharide/polyol phosphate transport system ATPase subunit
MQRNQWFAISSNNAQELRFQAALDAFANVLLLDDDPSLRAGDHAFYEQCRTMVAQVQSGELSAASARTQWSNGCRPQ